MGNGYNYTELELEARRLYNSYIHTLYYQLETYKGQLTRMSAEYLYNDAKKRLKKLEKASIMMFFSKFATPKKMKCLQDNLIYNEYVLSLFNNLSLDKIDYDFIENTLKSNKNQLYETFYKEKFELLIMNDPNSKFYGLNQNEK